MEPLSLELNLFQQLSNLLAQRLLVLDLPLGDPFPEPLEDLAGDALGLTFFLFQPTDDPAQDLGDGRRFERAWEKGRDVLDLVGQGRSVRMIRRV